MKVLISALHCKDMVRSQEKNSSFFRPNSRSDYYYILREA